MKVKNKLITILMFLMTNTLFAQKKIVFIDGNNNRYTISKKQIEYKAVKKEESSSGTYSGGKDTIVSISIIQYNEIKSIISQIKADKFNHIETRHIGCGTLILNQKTILININSKLLKQLVVKLKLLCNENGTLEITSKPIDLFNLEKGKKYAVIKPFIDFDKIQHTVGEIWLYDRKEFLPYSDGLTIYVFVKGKIVSFRFQDDENQQKEILNNFQDYMKEI